MVSIVGKTRFGTGLWLSRCRIVANLTWTLVLERGNCEDFTHAIDHQML